MIASGPHYSLALGWEREDQGSPAPCLESHLFIIGRAEIYTQGHLTSKTNDCLSPRNELHQKSKMVFTRVSAPLE